MIDRHHPDPAERAELTEQDLAIADARRPLHRAPRAPDERRACTTCSPSAAEFGDAAVDALRTVLACYEAMRAERRPSTPDRAPIHPRPRRLAMPHRPLARRYARSAR